MASPGGVLFVLVLLALAGERALGAVLRTNVRLFRYLRAAPPSRLPGLPGWMIARAQARGERKKSRAAGRIVPVAAGPADCRPAALLPESLPERSSEPLPERLSDPIPPLIMNDPTPAPVPPPAPEDLPPSVAEAGGPLVVAATLDGETAAPVPPSPSEEPTPPVATEPDPVPLAPTIPFVHSALSTHHSALLSPPGGMKIGLIGGSGLGDALRARAGNAKRHDVETPFGSPSDAVVEMDWGGVPVFFLSRHGPGHLLNPSRVPYQANLFALKRLGVTHVIASGAVGSLRDHIRPRDLVLPDQIIDKTTKRANTFYDRAAVHVEFAEPFCPVLRGVLVEAGREGGEVGSGDVGSKNAEELNSLPTPHTPTSPPFSVHANGCYVCMEGPAFSTRAESLMHRLWGGDLIGMTAMPEARLAREAEMSYALVALVTDYDCWRRPGGAGVPAGPGQVQQARPPAADPAVLLKEIIANLQAATDNGIRLIERAVKLMGGREAELMAAPALRALELAIWSDKSKIARDEVELLRPLWMRYFE